GPHEAGDPPQGLNEAARGGEGAGTASEGAATLAGPAVEFLAAARSGLDELGAREAASMATASAWIAEAIEAGGLVRIFGTGHSRLIAEEVFFRAGGLAPTDAILEGSG